MSRRKSLGNKLRFEVLKRDGFTCQYCGAKAPDVQLEVDHIFPVALGGKDEIDNLITACRNCNQGKKATMLTDMSYVEKHTRREDPEDENVRTWISDKISELDQKREEQEKEIHSLWELSYKVYGVDPSGFEGLYEYFRPKYARMLEKKGLKKAAEDLLEEASKQ